MKREQELKAAGFADVCVARCQLGLGPSVLFPFPWGSVRPLTALKPVSKVLLPSQPLPKVGTGPSSRPKLPKGSSASPCPHPAGYVAPLSLSLSTPPNLEETELGGLTRC